MKFSTVFKRRLSVKAAILFSVVVVLAAVFVITIGAWSDQKQARLQITYLANATADSAAIAATHALGTQNQAELSEIYLQTAKQGGVNAVFAIDVLGNPLFEGDQSHLSGNFERDLAVATEALETGVRSSRITDDEQRIAMPVTYNQQTVGALVVSFNRKAMLPSTTRVVLVNLWKGMALIGVGIPMALLVFGRLFAPVKELNRAAQKAAAGDLTARVHIKGEDEFASLANTLNLMFERMKINMDRTRWLAYGDDLTRLANKTAFNERLRQLVDERNANGSLYLIDLDGFKKINDAYGQEQGDEILRNTAARLRQVANQYLAQFSQEEVQIQPMIARLSGDEFGFLVPGCVSVPLAQQLAQNIQRAIKEPFELSGQMVSLTARIGIAMYPHDASDSKNLLGSVNFAIDVAKQGGGDGWQFFEPSMTQAAIRRVTLQNELQRAIKNREFVVYYQPKILVRDGATAGCEALVRWQKSPGKIVAPGAFIDVAEETGLINQIGDFVLEEACAAAARWAAEGTPCPVAVNVSSLQFARENFTDLVEEILKKTGLPHELLELELTESVAMTNPERLMEQVTPLRDKGVRFAIDDFGTGHSSLSYLTRLPFDVFKIDQSFVREMTEDKHARVIVQTVLAMAESLGYRTVAEGVETREHFAFLQLHCCDYVQGYYFSRPLPEDEFITVLTQDVAGQKRDNPALAQIA